MSVLKQVAVHNVSATVGLPREMADEILGFCFIDTVTAVQRAVQRANMAEVVSRFNGAWISRANTINMDNACETWSINLERIDHEEDDEVQFQATNCHTCGNYKMCRTFVPLEILVHQLQPATLDIVALCLDAIPIQMRCYCQ
jgi:hypothetical protein